MANEPLLIPGEFQESSTPNVQPSYWFDQFKYRNDLNYNQLPKGEEWNDQPSQVVPDQNLSLEELVKRSMRGQPLSGRLPINFGEDIHVPNWMALDLTERAQFRQEIANQIQTLRQKLDAENEALKSQNEKTPPPPPSNEL